MNNKKKKNQILFSILFQHILTMLTMFEYLWNIIINSNNFIIYKTIWRMCHSPLSTVTMSISKPCWKLIRKKIYCSMSWSSLQITYSKSVHVIVFFYSWNPNYTVAITRKVMFDTKDFLWYISLKWASIRFDSH